LPLPLSVAVFVAVPLHAASRLTERAAAAIVIRLVFIAAP